jgi:hypothetical protein
MSASVKLTAWHMQKIGEFLESLNKATRETGVQICVYQRAELAIDGNVLAVNYDADNRAYVIDGEWVGD